MLMKIDSPREISRNTYRKNISERTAMTRRWKSSLNSSWGEGEWNLMKKGSYSS